MQQSHLFSLYIPNLKLDFWIIDQIVDLFDIDLIHRLSKILRFEIGDQIVFFNKKISVNVVIQEISKKNIKIKVQAIQFHELLTPHITFLLPLLKKEALEQAVYSLCELGVNKIQLVITQKSRQNLLHDKEFVRLQKIVISAAEQSKNYNFSELIAPKKLTEIISKISNVIPGFELESNVFNIVFDPKGQSFFDLHEKLYSARNSLPINLLIGPEGGLVDQELQLVQKFDFALCTLTPTILTAVQAVALGAGLFRLK
ncbi:RsmE family RNA methyltransferase [Candidatus Babeliales bacterium]|nr:RsmE family RNA methyltransferase [Candidatus Babeliales bacterium]